ncbi:MAG: ATP-binding protein, partial [Nitrosomonadales bacterium]|nr:ATP-binding protein [Nitrosomonadales bacterium]
VEQRKQAQINYLSSNLGDIYVNEDGWSYLQSDPKRWGQLQRNGYPEHIDEPPSLRNKLKGYQGWDTPGDQQRKKKPPKFGRFALFDQDKQLIMGPSKDAHKMLLEPIRVEGKTVGYLGVMPAPRLSEAIDIQFVKEQTGAFALIALLLAGFLALVAWPLSNTLVRPIRRVTEASEALAQGRYDTQLKVTSRDELGQLAQSFNLLAQTLQRTEQARRLWMADVSHELRTPIALLQAELEAIQDGLRPLDKASVDSLVAEIYRMNRLVDDLYQLSLSDIGALSYHKTSIPLADVLQEAGDIVSEEFADKNVALKLEVPAQRLQIYADADRLSQLFSNLFTNALRYTDAGGQLVVTLSADQKHAILDFQDSAPGVPAEEQSRLFERFYRGDSSRNRNTGGAGLGLAICKNIVEAHGGQISVQDSPLGGLWVRILLPTM